MGCFKMKQKCEPKKIASAAYFLVTLYWGFTAVLMRDALVYMDSPSYVFLRFGFAGIVMLPFLWKAEENKKACGYKRLCRWLCNRDFYAVHSLFS